MLLDTFLSGCLIFGLAAGYAVPPSKSASSGLATCTNGPTSRGCWDQKYSIGTDSEESWPTTNKIVKYALEITNITISPDGVPRQSLVINGQYPGPVLYANWGDILQIDVTNKMQDNGTSIHWHGINQVDSCQEDGVNGVTECPIPPGATRTYTFQCTQHGTTWYHSHHSTQWGDGIVGTIIINGPASADYDEDLGVMPITDWYYKSMYEEQLAGSTGGPPKADNGLLNGTMMNVAMTAGHYFNTTLAPGKKYRLRLVNTAVDNMFKVSLDSHTLTIIEADFVAIVPQYVTWLFLGIGQRYDVVFTANQTPGNYWFRAEVQSQCGNNANNKILAIFNYDTVPCGIPSSIRVNYTQSCADETGLVPYVAKSASKADFTFNAEDTLNVGLTQVNNNFVWTINGQSTKVDWEMPTLQYVAEGNTTYTRNPFLGIYQLPDANVWSYWIIQRDTAQGTPPIPHPIHLHGHDFYLLGASAANAGQFTTADIASLNFGNPTRRDVAMLPPGGWLVIAFQTNNPGAWLMHCHIAWHVGAGLAVQFLERGSEISKHMDLSKISPNCKAWDAWYDSKHPALQIDSGL